MIRGDRIEARIAALGTSQAEVGRALGISQQAVGKMVKGGTRNTVHLFRLARALRTTPEYLLGETDDPNGVVVAASPPAAPMVMMPVQLPSERALKRMFEGLLEPLDRDISWDELAETLAEQLPIALAAVQRLAPAPRQGEAPESDAVSPASPPARRASQRSRHT